MNSRPQRIWGLASTVTGMACGKYLGGTTYYTHMSDDIIELRFAQWILPGYRNVPKYKQCCHFHSPQFVSNNTTALQIYRPLHGHPCYPQEDSALAFAVHDTPSVERCRCTVTDLVLHHTRAVPLQSSRPREHAQCKGVALSLSRACMFAPCSNSSFATPSPSSWNQ